MKTNSSAMQLSAVIATAALCAGLSVPVAAQSDFPAKNLQMVVPYTAGGSADAMSRAIAQRLSAAWGKNIVIDNRAGASGMIGAELVAKAEPDGYTLLGTTSSYPATAATRAKLPFDPTKAIVAVGTIARAPMLVAVHPSVPVKNIKELIALAKKNPGKFNYGSSGTGGNNHFSGALFAAAAGIKMVHVPYKGISLAVTAVASGEIEILISSSSALLPITQGNRVRILGVTSLEKSAMFPDVPTVASQGAPGYEYQLWWGIFAPAGLPADRLAFITAAINKIVASGDMKKFLDAQGAEPWTLPAAKLATLLPDEIARYKKAAQIAGIKPQ
ncbi:MAG: tripartite tricarboxylate transporter substrate binding protein [Betaproteobacteria bacterium]|jgi:tripartite-type tricarboxylate transporter receptor subunit TctC|nr:tripartite tricarboxylate transporter substrate binding protein [Betaproteobacteria bacterium]MDH4293134.1 tripartite tricarboxylate transporter substrate binding protein [Betaproteobacteria bacterium]MDH5341728.1 tripartite tricarboxylate transporter substrate binding protein [Betaproteobacteria bacterium]